jgi:hypothetical protein
MIGTLSSRVVLFFGNAIMVFLSMAFWLLPLPELGQEPQPKSDTIAAIPFERGSNAPQFTARSFFRPFVPDVPASPIVEPEPAPPQAPIEPQEAPRTLRLVGLIDQGAASIAFVLVEGQPGILRRVVGEDIDGWILTTIGRRTIELRRGQDTMLLALDRKVEP